MMIKQVHIRSLAVALSIALAAVAFACAGCASAGSSASSASSASSTPSATQLAGSYEQADLSDYACLKDYQQPLATYYNVTVRDVEKEMKEGSTFVLYTGFRDCPWCNVILPYLNDAAVERNVALLYLNTRSNPDWSSNLDIDDYDTFVSLFGDQLQTDSDGKKHLYVPHIFFVKDGKLVDDHSGTVPGQDSPSDELTQEQKDELKSTLDQEFATLGL